MQPRPTTPRIPPLAPADRSPSARALLEGVTVAGSEANIFTTLVRAEGLARRWLPFGGRLLNGKLPARDCELLILRTAWNCQAEYEWAQHVVLARAAGLTDTEIARFRHRRPQPPKLPTVAWINEPVADEDVAQKAS